MNLGRAVKVTRCLNAVAAGTTDAPGSYLDMSGFEGVLFIAAFGTATTAAVTSLHAEEATSSTGAGNSELADTAVDLDDNLANAVVVLDVYRPMRRYIRPVVDRGTANHVIDGVIAVQYGARKKPTTHDSSTVYASETHISPSTGTA